MTRDGETADAGERAWAVLLWERRLLAAMWLVWAVWLSQLAMRSLDSTLSLAMRALPEDVHRLFAIITKAGLSDWYLLAFGFGAVGLTAAGYLSGQGERANRLRRWAWILIFAFLAVLLSGLLCDLIKVLVGRARPKILEMTGFYGFLPISFSADFQSFPSGHANTAAVLALLVVYLRSEWGIWAWAFALPVIASRMIINAHFLGDVIGGCAIAFFSTWVLRDWFASHRVVFAFAPDGLIRRIQG